MNKSESKYFKTAIRFDKALLSLLENKQFEYITISEICEKAEVNRSTFYLHYENTSDLLKETVQYIIDDFLSFFPEDTKDTVNQFETCNLQDLYFVNEKYLFPYLLYIKKNQRIFQAMVSQPMLFGGEAIYKRLYNKIFNPVLERFHYPLNERQYVMMFYCNGITAIITQWLKDGCTKSIEDITTIICYCIFGREG